MRNKSEVPETSDNPIVYYLADGFMVRSESTDHERSFLVTQKEIFCRGCLRITLLNGAWRGMPQSTGVVL